MLTTRLNNAKKVLLYCLIGFLDKIMRNQLEFETLSVEYAYQFLVTRKVIKQ